MSELRLRGELIKLARILDTTSEAVGFLSPLGADAVRQLEAQISVALYDEYRPALQRLADASKLLPASLVAKMSEMVFGPMLSARVAGLMAPDRAIEVSTRLKAPFLAEVCVELDPRGATELLARFPVKTVIEVARVLTERREYVTMGRFVDAMPDASIRAVLDAIDDDAALLSVGQFIDRAERLAELVGLIPTARLAKLVTTTARGAPEIQMAGLAMMSRVSGPQQARIGEVALSLPLDTVRALIATVRREGVEEVVLGLVSHPAVAAAVRRAPALVRAELKSAASHAGLIDRPGLKSLLG